MLRHGLVKAVKNSQPAITSYLLARGAKIDEAVTIKAAEGRCLQIFQSLYEHGWDVNEPTLFGSNILTHVIDNEQLVRWLLDKGTNPNQGAVLCSPDVNKTTDNESGEVLNAAAEKAPVVVFDLLLARGARLERSHPLYFAAKGGRNNMIRRLLELQVDINGLDDSRGPYKIGTPLHYAARFGHAETVRYLLQEGADPSITGLESLFREAEPFVEVTEVIRNFEVLLVLVNL
ncbi:ankyrin repeat-containing domain protein [Aspergillus novoparasiticus]|uniref:Ankyrin repeat-containing domain protein n=1 Tax=Aspergillus novoparasiticus TaxID=986946 RepID=A0A5N6EA95_9EURO|nr:ankyrin repeat-containing domain protein [Aspergillus novoparasiticus]